MPARQDVMKGAALIVRAVVSADCPDIMAVARSAGVEVIDRPALLAANDSQMVDAILHALKVIGEKVEFLVTRHANCATHRADLIDTCIRRLRGIVPRPGRQRPPI